MKAHTMINHEREPHCIGCYVIEWNGGEPISRCNECGHTVDLLGQLATRAATLPQGVSDQDALGGMFLGLQSDLAKLTITTDEGEAS